MDSLQLCKGSKCGAACGKYHPWLDETVENVIFEIWARSFFDANGRKSPQDQASLSLSSCVFLKVPWASYSPTPRLECMQSQEDQNLENKMTDIELYGFLAPLRKKLHINAEPTIGLSA